MKITALCPNCRARIAMQTLAQDRVQLAKEKGEQLKFKCKECDSTVSFSVDDFSASPNRKLRLIALITLFVGTPWLLWFYAEYILQMITGSIVVLSSGIFLLPVVLYALILRGDQNRVNAFNRHRLKGRVTKSSS